MHWIAIVCLIGHLGLIAYFGNRVFLSVPCIPPPTKGAVQARAALVVAFLTALLPPTAQTVALVALVSAAHPVPLGPLLAAVVGIACLLVYGDALRNPLPLLYSTNDLIESTLRENTKPLSEVHTAYALFKLTLTTPWKTLIPITTDALRCVHGLHVAALTLSGVLVTALTLTQPPNLPAAARYGLLTGAMLPGLVNWVLWVREQYLLMQRRRGYHAILPQPSTAPDHGDDGPSGNTSAASSGATAGDASGRGMSGSGTDREGGGGDGDSSGPSSLMTANGEAIREEVRARPSPPTVYSSSLIGLLFFNWITPLVLLRQTRPIEKEDMFPLRPSLQTQTTGPKMFQPAWRKELDARDEIIQDINQTGGLPDAEIRERLRVRRTLWRALLRAYGRRLGLVGLFKLANDICVLLSPILLRKIVQHLQFASENPTHPSNVSTGLLYALSLMLIYLIQSLFFNHYFASNVYTMAELGGGLVTAIYDKSLKLSSKARLEFTTGLINNLMAGDARGLSELPLYIHTLWSGMLQITVSMALLIGLLGVFPTFAGVLFILLSIPIQGHLVSILRTTRERASAWTDERVKVVGEALDGIRLVKLYSWESAFHRRILRTRLGEMKFIRRNLYVQATNNSLTNSVPTVLSLITFAVFVLLQGNLDAAIVFPAIALFNVLRAPMIMFPATLGSLARSSAAVDRIERFLLADEVKSMRVGPHAVTQEEFDTSNCDVLARDATLSWETADTSDGAPLPTLTNVSLAIPSGSLTCVVGHTASGKSSLLFGLLGEVGVVCGQIGLNPRRAVALCDQTPFIYNATLRDNILYGKSMDYERYRRVLRVCQLLPDLKVLPAGDLTEIGGRGVNLSGGQKSRVSLARAVYSDADIVLMDAPLAAVDAHVGKAIFENAISSELAGRTRVLATNHLNFAASPSVDFIAVVSNGKLVEFGRRHDLLHDRASTFAKMVAEQASDDVGGGEEGDNGDAPTDERGGGEDHSKSGASQSLPSPTVADSKIGAIASSNAASATEESERSIDGVVDESGIQPEFPATVQNTADKIDTSADAAVGARNVGQLTAREGKAVGHVAKEHYNEYLKASGGWPHFAIAVGLAVAGQGLSIGVNVWLSVWSEHTRLLSYDTVKEHTTRNLLIYAGLSFAAVLAASLSQFSVMDASVRASVSLHEKLCYRVFRAPMSFFDTTPTGRILNRFNASIDKLDTQLALAMQQVLRTGLMLLGTILIITYSTPAFLLLALPVFATYVYIQGFYRNTSVDLRRLESVARSPMYTHFGETLDGVVTIRAYGSGDRLREENSEYADLYVATQYTSLSANRWLSVRLEVLAATLIFGAASLAVIEYRTVSPEMSGLVLSYAMQIVSTLTWAVRQVTETESQMSAIEQISEYSSVPPFPQEEKDVDEGVADLEEQEEIGLHREESHGLVTKTLVRGLIRDGRHRRQARWPRRGRINIEQAVMRYRPELDPALRGVSMSIEPGWHVGVIGRTGAGKSSLVGTLFRLQELESGRIVIDGDDIAHMSLADLRSSLGVIAQEAVLFSGTIRSNLDMAGIYEERAIQKAFDLSGMRETSSRPIGLDTVVEEGGANLSAGQRQLLCLGRALLRDSMVLVLDEATASLDDWTDRKLGDTIRSEMGHCTIITVAHRLHTVMRCDRVCVMDRGVVAEFGTPLELLEREPKTQFASLVEETGPKTAAYLRRLAKNPNMTPSSSLGSISSNAASQEEPASIKTPRMDRAQDAYKNLRSAIVDIDSPEWAREIQLSSMTFVEWKTALKQMVASIAVLAQTSLGEPGEARAEDSSLEATYHEIDPSTSFS